MKSDARQKILEAGAQIIHRKGYNHTGIQEVLQAAGVPKGSFYFYFKNKEDFGLQVIEYFNHNFAEMLAPILKNHAITPLERLERIFDWFIEYFTEIKFTNGCPIGNLGQEMGDLSEAFSEKLKDALNRLVNLYAGILQEAVDAGEIPGHLDPGETAAFIVSGWHGALIRMKIFQSAEPLENHKQFILKHILRHPE